MPKPKNNPRTLPTPFQKGLCRYRTAKESRIDPIYFASKEWKDGYYAFSHREIRKRTFEKKFDIEAMASLNLFDDRLVLDDENAYLNEIGLWGPCPFDALPKPVASVADTAFREISMEREREAFFLQEWILVLPTDPSLNVFFDKGCQVPGWERCYFRKVAPSSTTAIINDKSLAAMEIIIPEKRLILPENRYHLFLTIGD